MFRGGCKARRISIEVHPFCLVCLIHLGHCPGRRRLILTPCAKVDTNKRIFALCDDTILY
jgi:hypothetical protein